MPQRRVTRKKPGSRFNLDQTTIEALVDQRVSNDLANRNVESRKGRGTGGDSTWGGNGSQPRACTYKEFRGCKPKPFLGNEGLVGLTRWIEKMESVFEFSFCSEESKVRFDAYTFKDTTLPWWNGHTKTIGISAANSISWKS